MTANPSDRFYVKCSHAWSSAPPSTHPPVARTRVCQRVRARVCRGHTCECVFLVGVYYSLFVLLMLLASGGAIFIYIQM